MRTHEIEGTTVAVLYDEPTGSFQYVFSDDATAKAVVIDPVLDFDPAAGATSTYNADHLLDHIRKAELDVVLVIDTHPHADHFSAVPYIAAAVGAPIATGARVRDVQALWRDIYCLPDLPVDGSQWDRLLADGDVIEVGSKQLRVLLSPGHTLASVTLVGPGYAFIHDTLMMPDVGTSRADFPGGDATQLYRSIDRILALPDDTALFVGHDYGLEGREPKEIATVAEQKRSNIHVGGGRGQAEFVQLREKRDATLPLPKLMLAALQINIRGGRLPTPEACGRSFLRIPLDYFEPVEPA